MTENKWLPLENALNRLETHPLGKNITDLEAARFDQEQVKLEILLKIAKSLDHLDNYGITTGSP